jgi:hypothetical protein
LRGSIDEEALRRIQPDARPDESGFLKAFDINRDLICAAAAKVYVRGSRMDTRPAYQLAQTEQLQIKPSSGATFVRSLSPKAAVTVSRAKAAGR